MDDCLRNHILGNPFFDLIAYEKVLQAKMDLIYQTNLEASLSILSSLDVNIFLLELTGIEAVLSSCVKGYPPRTRVICEYILRKFEKEKKAGWQDTKVPRRMLAPRRPECRKRVTQCTDEFIFAIMKRRKMIPFNKRKREMLSLKNLCRAKIMKRVYVAASSNSVYPLIPLIKHVSKERMELMEIRLPCIIEISGKLWETMLFHHFRGYNHTEDLTDREAFHYLWTKKKEFSEKLAQARALRIMPKAKRVTIGRLLNGLILFLVKMFT